MENNYPDWLEPLLLRYEALLTAGISNLIHTKGSEAKALEKARISALHQAFEQAWSHYSGELWPEADKAIIDYLKAAMLGQSRH